MKCRSWLNKPYERYKDKILNKHTEKDLSRMLLFIENFLLNQCKDPISNQANGFYQSDLWDELLVRPSTLEYRRRTDYGVRPRKNEKRPKMPEEVPPGKYVTVSQDKNGNYKVELSLEKEFYRMMDQLEFLDCISRQKKPRQYARSKPDKQKTYQFVNIHRGFIAYLRVISNKGGYHKVLEYVTSWTGNPEQYLITYTDGNST